MNWRHFRSPISGHNCYTYFNLLWFTWENWPTLRRKVVRKINHSIYKLYLISLFFFPRLDNLHQWWRYLVFTWSWPWKCDLCESVCIHKKSRNTNFNTNTSQVSSKSSNMVRVSCHCHMLSTRWQHSFKILMKGPFTGQCFHCLMKMSSDSVTLGQRCHPPRIRYYNTVFGNALFIFIFVYSNFLFLYHG